MQLGALLARLENETDAARALAALGDAALSTQVETYGAQFDETPGEYVANAVRRFAATASDDDWLALMGAVERTKDPAQAALDKMLRWAFTKDASDGAQTGCGCGSGAGGCHGHT